MQDDGGKGRGDEAAPREEPPYEVAIVLPRRTTAAGGSNADGGGAQGKRQEEDCVEFLVRELVNAGLRLDRVHGVPAHFLKVAAPIEALGRAATEMQMKKLTHLGMELPFEWDQVNAFVMQPDGSLFSWFERYSCYMHLIYGIINMTDLVISLRFDDKVIQYQRHESLLRKLEVEGIIQQVFPLHDEVRRKHLIKSWALNFLDFTSQPIDQIYSYYGTKIATYFSFLGMYTRWLFFPGALGLATQFIDFGKLKTFVLPCFFLLVISWAVFFLQFWKRKNSALLARWGINYSMSEYKAMNNSANIFSLAHLDEDSQTSTARRAERKKLQRAEWLDLLLRIRNNVIVVLAIICLQLPFELAYVYVYGVTQNEILRYLLTAVYLVIIQYYTQIGGKVSLNLIKREKNQGEESNAASLVYKVFGLYFVQSYIGLFYHALLHRNILALRRVVIQRLIVSQVLENLIENSIPFLKYSYKKFSTVRKKKHETTGTPTKKVVRLSTRVEKEYLKPSYSASIGVELEDGLFDDFLELALQFGMMTMFACAFPLIFCFATLNNITEIRADALKLLVMLRRPVPRAAATIGAWLNIFQFLIVMAICTNCLLLIFWYDQEGKWKVEPGLAAILIMEHVLLFIKFGLSHFVPEEPAWVKAKRFRSVAQLRDVCSKELLRSISRLELKKKQ